MMRQELIDKLYNDFPKLYRKDFNNFWITYDGWFDLIYDLSKEINSIIINLESFGEDIDNYYLVQIKEKFGSLRYYLQQSTKEMDDIIAIFENKSYDICALCGKDKGPRSAKESAWGLNFCETCNIIKNIIE
jgi:hypothetical protein